MSIPGFVGVAVVKMEITAHIDTEECKGCRAIAPRRPRLLELDISGCWVMRGPWNIPAGWHCFGNDSYCQTCSGIVKAAMEKANDDCAIEARRCLSPCDGYTVNGEHVKCNDRCSLKKKHVERHLCRRQAAGISFCPLTTDNPPTTDEP